MARRSHCDKGADHGDGSLVAVRRLWPSGVLMFVTPRIEAAIHGIIAWWVTGVVVGAFLKPSLHERTPWPAALLSLTFLIAVPLSAGVVIGRHRYRALMGRFPLGHCQKCGYDLTGNASGRCPECGQQVR